MKTEWDPRAGDITNVSSTPQSQTKMAMPSAIEPGFAMDRQYEGFGPGGNSSLFKHKPVKWAATQPRTLARADEEKTRMVGGL